MSSGSWGPSWRQAGLRCDVAKRSEDPWLRGPSFVGCAFVEVSRSGWTLEAMLNAAPV
jgi:hypothetical protein